MKTKLFEDNGFASRHIGPRDSDVESMLQAIGTGSLDQLIDETIPGAIRLTSEPDLSAPVSEYAFLENLRSVARNNKVLKSYLGQGTMVASRRQSFSATSSRIRDGIRNTPPTSPRSHRDGSRHC